MTARGTPAAVARAPVGVLVFTADDGVVDVSPAWTDATGLSREQSLGDGWLVALAGRSRARAAAQLHDAATGSPSAGAEWELVPEGDVRRIDAVAQPLPSPTATPRACIVAMVDVTNVAAREDELVHAATHDALSGLLNRGAFDAIVDHALTGAERRRSTVAVLLIDLDGFKSVNDCFGHTVGDDVLIAVSDRLVSVLRPNDTIARRGGDEFVVLCEDVHRAEEAVVVAERIVEAMGRPFDIGAERIQLAASVGVAVADDASTTRLLVERADRAMYRAKDLGHGRIAIGGAAQSRTFVQTATAPSHDVEHDPALDVASCVEVRERFRGGWIGGFDVAAVTARGFRLRRRSDNHVLPVEFARDVVRRAR